MTVFKNKLFVLLFVTLTICAFSWQWLYQRSQVTKQELLVKIEDGYTRQFCNIIFPHISDCVTLPQTGCNDFANKTLDACTADLNNSLPDRLSSVKAKEIYEKVAACFELNAHAELRINYAIDTPECRQKLS